MRTSHRVFAVILLALSASACKTEPTSTPAPGDNDAWPAPGPVSARDDPELRAIAARLPGDWSGTGVLEQRESVPPGAPDWVRVVAEIVGRDGKHYLRASGIAPRIRNSALGRTAADNRARAELLRWIGSQRLVGSEILDHWGVPGRAFCALARLEVPATWQPGRRLPPGPEPANEPEVETK